MNFYTSDTHFSHTNIIKHSNRPFGSVEEMDRVLIDNINNKVGPNDTLYHLGDWSLGLKHNKAQQLVVAQMKRLAIKCKNVILIFGNHDKLRDNSQFRSLFTKTADMLEVADQFVGQKIVLCHYALRVWNAGHHGRWHLYGHSHGNLPEADNFSFDVGVDCHNFAPLSSLEVAAIMSAKATKGVKATVHHENH